VSSFYIEEKPNVKAIREVRKIISPIIILIRPPQPVSFEFTLMVEKVIPVNDSRTLSIVMIASDQGDIMTRPSLGKKNKTITIK